MPACPEPDKELVCLFVLCDFHLVKMELMIFSELNWEIGWITPWSFIEICFTKLRSEIYDENKLKESLTLVMKGRIKLQFFMI